MDSSPCVWAVHAARCACACVGGCVAGDCGGSNGGGRAAVRPQPSSAAFCSAVAYSLAALAPAGRYEWALPVLPKAPLRPTPPVPAPLPAPMQLPVAVLGDVVVSLDTAARQAAERGYGLRDECRVLLVHGVLHLFGFDHELGGWWAVGWGLGVIECANGLMRGWSGNG